MSASDVGMFANKVLKTHPDNNKSDFIYVIQVSFLDSKWEIQKRHQDLQYFSDMMAEAVKQSKVVAKEFPAKSFGKTTFEEAIAKIPEINAWLAEFLANSDIPAGSAREQQLFNFMAVYMHQPPLRDRMCRALPDRVLHMGYLRKLGGNKNGGAGNWKRRYVVLQQDLRYYEDEDSFRNGGLPKGVILLNAFCVERRPDALLNEFVVHAMPYPLVCRAASEEDLDAWTTALQQVGDGVRGNGIIGLAMADKNSRQQAEEEVVSEEDDVKWAN